MPIFVFDPARLQRLDTASGVVVDAQMHRALLYCLLVRPPASYRRICALADARHSTAHTHTVLLLYFHGVAALLQVMDDVVGKSNYELVYCHHSGSWFSTKCVTTRVPLPRTPRT